MTPYNKSKSLIGAICLTLFCLPALANSDTQPPFSFLLDIGAHQLNGHYDWTVLGDLEGSDDSIVSARQKYSQIKAQGTHLHTALGFAVSHNASILLDLEGFDSDISSGEFSASSAITTDDETTEIVSQRQGDAEDDDITLHQASFVFRSSMAQAPELLYSWHLGYSDHQQSFVLNNALQTMPQDAAGPIDNYGATSEIQWTGYWLGLEMMETRGAHTLSIRYQHYVSVDFEAEGDWELANSLQHPVSFEQTAKAEAGTLRLEYRYALSNYIELGSSYHWNRFIAEDGDYTLFNTDGSQSKTPLDEVNWNFYTISIGLSIKL